MPRSRGAKTPASGLHIAYVGGSRSSTLGRDPDVTAQDLAEPGQIGFELMVMQRKALEERRRIEEEQTHRFLAADPEAQAQLHGLERRARLGTSGSHRDGGSRVRGRRAAKPKRKASRPRPIAAAAAFTASTSSPAASILSFTVSQPIASSGTAAQRPMAAVAALATTPRLPVPVTTAPGTLRRRARAVVSLSLHLPTLRHIVQSLEGRSGDEAAALRVQASEFLALPPLKLFEASVADGVRRVMDAFQRLEGGAQSKGAQIKTEGRHGRDADVIEILSSPEEAVRSWSRTGSAGSSTTGGSSSSSLIGSNSSGGDGSGSSSGGCGGGNSSIGQVSPGAACGHGVAGSILSPASPRRATLAERDVHAAASKSHAAQWPAMWLGPGRSTGVRRSSPPFKRVRPTPQQRPGGLAGKRARRAFMHAPPGLDPGQMTIPSFAIHPQQLEDRSGACLSTSPSSNESSPSCCLASLFDDNEPAPLAEVGTAAAGPADAVAQ